MSKSKFENDKVTLGLIMFFYFASCGSERLFQSLEFTFGLCGPLNLPASKAVITDTCYNGGFFVGRMVSVMCPKIMSPKLMVKVRLHICTFCSSFDFLLQFDFYREINFTKKSCKKLYGKARILLPHIFFVKSILE